MYSTVSSCGRGDEGRELDGREGRKPFLLLGRAPSPR